MASGNTDTRPLSPHLQVWRWHPTMLSSILHRVSGIGNYLGAIALTAWLVMLATGTEGSVAFLFNGPMEWVTRIGLILLTWSVSFHFLNGLRHLAWDAGKGFDPKGSNQRSILIIIGSIILPAILWFFLLTGGAS
ncbi:MAG: succinate dehydrogenase, cytochrome b556 subunit [Hyphobacterium sp.]|nr:MAG: succinate dehydrogenase, cytochrome b556 subunit [Hyphobacterium sp.]